MHIKRSITIC